MVSDPEPVVTFSMLSDVVELVYPSSVLVPVGAAVAESVTVPDVFDHIAIERPRRGAAQAHHARGAAQQQPA